MKDRSIELWCTHLEAVAAEAARSGAYAAFHEAEIAAFEACEDGSELWSLAGCDVLAEATFAEDAYPPGVVDAVLAHAGAWESAEDRALAWALAARILAFEPGKLVMLDEDAIGTKPELQAAFERHLARHREGARDEDARVRAAALHALGCCRELGAADVEAVAAHLARDDDDEARASAALALGASLGRRPELLHTLSPAWPERGSVLVRACAAAGEALAGGELSAAGAAALAEAISAPAPLPVGWGWRWLDKDETSADLAVRVLAWARVPPEGRAPVVEALAGLARRDQPHDAWEDVIFQIAFGAPEELPPFGLSARDLDAPQTQALRAAAEPRQAHNPWLVAIGVSARDEIAALLAERPPLFAPLTAGDRATNLVGLWRALVGGAVEPAEAATIVAESLAIEDALAAITGVRLSLLARVNRHNEPRHLAGVAAVVRELARAADLVPLLATPALGGPSRPAWAIASLVAHELRGDAPPADSWERLRRGLGMLPPDLAEPLVAWLPTDIRAALTGDAPDPRELSAP